MGLWKEYTIATNKLDRLKDRKSLLTRKEILVERLPSMEFLRDDYLDTNDFDKSCIFRQWAEQDLEELDELDNILSKIEALDGPPTEDEIISVKQYLHELEEEIKLKYD